MTLGPTKLGLSTHCFAYRPIHADYFAWIRDAGFTAIELWCMAPHVEIEIAGSVAYFGKLAIHPVPVPDWSEFLARAAIGPIPGIYVVLAGVAFHGGWIFVALHSFLIEKRARAGRSLISIA